jgi:hypothetical protein
MRARSDHAPGVTESATASALSPSLQHAQWKQPKERSAPADVLAVLAIEGPRVPRGVECRPILLRAACSAAALAFPSHRDFVARETEAMTEQTTPEHRDPAYNGAGKGLSHRAR